MLLDIIDIIEKSFSNFFVQVPTMPHFQCAWFATKRCWVITRVLDVIGHFVGTHVEIPKTIFESVNFFNREKPKWKFLGLGNRIESMTPSFHSEF